MHAFKTISVRFLLHASEITHLLKETNTQKSVVGTPGYFTFCTSRNSSPPMSKYNNLSHLGSLDHLGIPTEKTISIPRPVLVHERRHSVGSSQSSSGVPTQEQRIRHPIVIVRDAVKSYGRGAGCKNVLNNLNMTVRRGDIYGLLGASGCGKTSLLSMLVGRRVVDSGMVQVMGGEPGDRSCGIPGRKVGQIVKFDRIAHTWIIRLGTCHKN